MEKTEYIAQFFQSGVVMQLVFHLQPPVCCMCYVFSVHEVSLPLTHTHTHANAMQC